MKLIWIARPDQVYFFREDTLLFSWKSCSKLLTMYQVTSKLSKAIDTSRYKLNTVISGIRTCGRDDLWPIVATAGYILVGSRVQRNCHHWYCPFGLGFVRKSQIWIILDVFVFISSGSTRLFLLLFLIINK